MVSTVKLRRVPAWVWWVGRRLEGIELLPVLEAIVELAEHLVHQVPQGGGVSVAVGSRVSLAAAGRCRGDSQDGADTRLLQSSKLASSEVFSRADWLGPRSMKRPTGAEQLLLSHRFAADARGLARGLRSPRCVRSRRTEDQGGCGSAATARNVSSAGHGPASGRCVVRRGGTTERSV
jgi:hypothetical protein